MKPLFLLLVPMFLAGGVSQTSWTPAVDTANDPKAADLTKDEAECRELAKQGAGSAKQVGEGAAEGAEKDVVTQKMENYLAAYVESIAKQRSRNVEWAKDAVINSVAVTAEEALELNVIDFVVNSREELLTALEGSVVELNGKEAILSLAGAKEVLIEKTLLQAIFDVDSL